MILCLLLAFMDDWMIERMVHQLQFSYDLAWETFTAQTIPENLPISLKGSEDTENNIAYNSTRFAEYMTVYQMLSGITDENGNQIALNQWGNHIFSTEEMLSFAKILKEEYPKEFETLYTYNRQIWQAFDAQQPIVFPVGNVVDNPDATYVYEDSWANSRTYGGNRRHEGCDIMATVNERGIYPIYSVTSGTVEKMGWLPQGGYRVGIRGENGVYYYYAHLASYADNLQVGDRVTSGSLLGWMGDTGYSEVEGTTGNFPVHLHFGIYLDDEAGEEFAVNSYYFLKMLESM